MLTKRISLWLLLGDGVALSRFIVTGILTHENIFTWIRFALNLFPVWAAWALAAWVWGALYAAELSSLKTMWGRTLTAWLVAAPVGLVLRALLTGSKSIIVIFMLVALGSGGAFLLAWRALAVWLIRRAPVQRSAT